MLGWLTARSGTNRRHDFGMASIIYRQAENRMHVQKAIILHLLGTG